MTISTNLILSVAGGLASLVGLAYYGWQYVPKIRLPARKEPEAAAGPTPDDDRHTVLAIQGRLKASGNAAAAATAYRLLGEMSDMPKTEPERKKL